MIEIDASFGEGGGQIVRTAVALAACTGAPLVLRNIRARRSKPGLRAQHLAAIRAAAMICGARVSGAETASQTLAFAPGRLRPGCYRIDVGTAGSTMLVLQTILPPLSLCSGPSEVVLQGGTHNPRAPTFEFVRDAYLPLLGRLGFSIKITLDRHGFYPRGGGQIRASIVPLRRTASLDLCERGAVLSSTARVLLAGLPLHIGQREIGVLRGRLGLTAESCGVDTISAAGAGNAVHVRIDCAHVSTVFVGFGMQGVPAETVASRLAVQVERYLSANVVLDTYLADQLLLPLALAGGGRFTTLKPSAHTDTNAAVVRTLLPVDYQAHELGSDRWSITIRSATSTGQMAQ
jgi:RNA 3'-terminal phosphate cyclase (ATP)